MAEGLQIAVNICLVFLDLLLPSCCSAGGRAFDEFFLSAILIFRDNDIINGIFNDFCSEMFELSKLRREAPVKLFTSGVLAFPTLDHNVGLLTIILFKDAANPVTIF